MIYCEEFNTLEYWSLSKYPKSFYRLLGIVLDYYAGSYSPNRQIIQQYTKFESPKNYTDWSIDKVEKVILTFMSDLNLLNDLKIEKNLIEENKDKSKSIYSIKIKSQSVCSYLESIDFQNVSHLFVPLSRSTTQMYHLALLQRLEFILGTYINAYKGKKSTWIFFNNFQKFNLVYEFMTNLADEEDIINTESKFLTPHSHSITLNTEGNLWKIIDKQLNN